MQIGSAFPSNYIKTEDLQGRNITVTIDRVEMEKVGEDHRPVIYFQGKEKGLVLNKTNAQTISAIYGGETEDWQGGEIILYPTETDYQGKRVPAIRIKIPPRKPARATGAVNGQPVVSTEPLDDDIPF